MGLSECTPEKGPIYVFLKVDCLISMNISLGEG